MTTLALQTTFTNNSSTAACTVLGPSLGTLIQEPRIYMGNVEVERVTYYNKTESMFSRFSPFDKRAQMYEPYFKYSRNFIRGGNNYRNWLITCGHCTEVRFASFFSGGFTTMAVINPLERKLEKRKMIFSNRY